jgi:hypothetical protein
MNITTAGLLFAVSAFACNKEVPKAAEEPRVVSSPPNAKAETGPTVPAAADAPASSKAGSPAAEAPAPGVQAASKVSDSTFELTFAGKDSYETGKPADATITLDAKAPFHVNDKYPYKFKLKEAAGLKFPSPVVGKDAAKLEKSRVTMNVGFVPETPGKHTIAGVLSFSICTDDKCLIEKRDLSLDVTSK